MNRTLTVERLYSLGDYRNIKFGDTIADIPEDLALDIEFTSRLYTLMMVQAEQAYYRYVDVGKLQNRNVHTQEEVNAMLEEQRVTLFSELKQIMNGEITEDKETEDTEEVENE